MQALLAPQNDGSEGQTPLSPEELVEHMDATAAYVAGRGLPVLIAGHYVWMMRYLAAHFERDPGPASVTISLKSGIPGLSAEVKFDAGRNRAASAVLLGAVRALGSAVQLGRSLGRELTVNALRTTRAFARESIPAAPPLFAAIVIVFLTGDAWKILARGFDWRLGALLGFLVAVAMLVVADLRHLRRHASASGDEFTDMVAASPAAPLAESLNVVSRQPLRTRPLYKLELANVAVIYMAMIAANLLVIGVLVAGTLLVVGMIRVDAAMTATLTGRPAHVLWRLPVDHMVLTRELLTLSLSLGTLAALSFTVAGLSDREARARFARRATAGLRRVLSAHAVYDAAIDNEEALTGVKVPSPGSGPRP